MSGDASYDSLFARPFGKLKRLLGLGSNGPDACEVLLGPSDQLLEGPQVDRRKVLAARQP
jgi:hypothetical protein